MGTVPDELKYTKEHEWLRIEDDGILIGITDFAQNALTEVVWVELPELGASVDAMESFASVESVKSVSEIYAPIAGSVIDINEELEDTPEIINEDPYGRGWICKMEIENEGDLEALLDAGAYAALIGE
ncbi:MAG TPA: glycine cleavage system protein GcvH [Candidatus Thalassarchaeaceae archaeon]|nr:glycine cleavage system protein GcvH [Candidatus Thalassarchaeaceae archaeon]